MSLHESRGQLTRALEDLMIQWHRTRDAWRDRRAAEFEKRILEPLAAEVKQTANAMERMAGNLHKVRADCSVPTD